MIDHDRFEMLAGAVMLGEATDAERATFAAHAASCEPCRLDVACAPAVMQTIESAKAAETWRPTVVEGILRRIRESRTSRFGATVGFLGWGVALSIVLNVAFVSGLSAHIHDAFEPPADVPTIGAMKIVLESPAPHVAVVVVPHPHPATVAWTRPKSRKRFTLPQTAAPLVDRATALDGVSIPAAARADVPDVLAGIDVNGTDGSGAKHVAVQPRCPSAPDPVATDAGPIPCPSGQEIAP